MILRSVCVSLTPAHLNLPKKVRGIGKTFDTLGDSVYDEIEHLQSSGKIKPINSSDTPSSTPKPEKADSFSSVYFEAPVGRVETPVFLLDKLDIGDEVWGPAMVIDDTQSIVVIPGAKAVVTSKHLYITLE